MDMGQREFWDTQAASFDEQPDHGLLDGDVRSAWADLLLPLLPPPGAAVVDLGCGTGSLSVLLAQAGYDVRGLDLSDQMVALARSKAAAAGVTAVFEQGDASAPPYPPGSADVVLVRHVLWALPDPTAAVRRWSELLGPAGMLLLVEGRWWTGGGLSAAECEAVVRTTRMHAVVTRLDAPMLWGRPIDDERYLLVSRS
jgi:2-polyprenyl-3-methyl-5-hydroxy-6-metoxy-1,4-benzoquinol methylase